jgi:hypothetical protein
MTRVSSSRRSIYFLSMISSKNRFALFGIML